MENENESIVYIAGEVIELFESQPGIRTIAKVYFPSMLLEVPLDEEGDIHLSDRLKIKARIVYERVEKEIQLN